MTINPLNSIVTAVNASTVKINSAFVGEKVDLLIDINLITATSATLIFKAIDSISAVGFLMPDTLQVTADARVTKQIIVPMGIDSIEITATEVGGVDTVIGIAGH